MIKVKMQISVCSPRAGSRSTRDCVCVSIVSVPSVDSPAEANDDFSQPKDLLRLKLIELKHAAHLRALASPEPFFL